MVQYHCSKTYLLGAVRCHIGLCLYELREFFYPASAMGIWRPARCGALLMCPIVEAGKTKPAEDEWGNPRTGEEHELPCLAEALVLLPLKHRGPFFGSLFGQAKSEQKL